MEGDLLVVAIVFPWGDCLATIIEEHCSVDSFEVEGSFEDCLD